jgi:hypothetical protein
MEPTFTKTNRSPIMMRCLGSGCNVFLVSGSNVVSGGTPVSEELDELIEMARTIRMMMEQGIPCLERRETWGTRGAALPTATSRFRMIPSHER